MKAWIPLVGLVFVFSACDGQNGAGHGPEPPLVESGFITNQRIIFSDGLHNENTEMIRLSEKQGGRILLAFRGGEEGQTGSERAHINIYESLNNGLSFTKISEVTMPSDPDEEGGGRDIRDPKFVELRGKLFLYAISRLPGFSYRDLFQEAWTVRAESTDGGHTWTTPVRTFQDSFLGLDVYWGMWRFTKRQYEENGKARETIYSTGYDDGDISVGLFRSDDGVNWKRVAFIISNYNDVPSEAELQFFGENNEKAVVLVRMDNQGILTDGQTAICTSKVPFTTWRCNRRIEQRLDGPTWIVRREGDEVRNFVFARKHLPCTFKRTAAYELRGDLTDPTAEIEVCEIQEVKSSGDTAYTALVPTGQDRYLLSWYSSPVDEEPAWLEGQFSPSDIWLADVDFSQLPDTCTPPPEERACEAPPLPESTDVFDVTGEYLMSLGPVIWPSNPLYFVADVTLQDGMLDFSLQPVEPENLQPVGDPWNKRDVPIEPDGGFDAYFGSRTLPSEAYPVLDAPIPLQIKKFRLLGKTTSIDSFCGNVEGFVQLLPPKSDRILLYGSTFGAARITNGIFPKPVLSCQ